MIVERLRLMPGTEEFQEISNLFEVNCTTKKHRLEIQTIEKVFNDMLINKFYAKEQEYINTFGHVRTFRLFHGTKKSNVSSILSSNLDVSRHGRNVGHRFGAGVSFSAQASYASHYCDGSDLDTMLLCNVLIANITEVPESRSNLNVLHEPPYIPGMHPLRYDTTAKDKSTMNVIVKFENYTFCPTYVITFKRHLHHERLTSREDDETERLILEHAKMYFDNLRF